MNGLTHCRDGIHRHTFVQDVLHGAIVSVHDVDDTAGRRTSDKNAVRSKETTAQPSRLPTRVTVALKVRQYASA
jgi:hypothetical protein